MSVLSYALFCFPKGFCDICLHHGHLCGAGAPSLSVSESAAWGITATCDDRTPRTN